MLGNIVLKLTTYLLISLISMSAFALENHIIKNIRILGAERSKADWIYEYLNLSAPGVISDFEIQSYASKLLTTGVFQDAEVYLDVDDPRSQQKILVIDVKEKWTTIPVIRGEFGGGTPLKVLGVYDTHSFGRLWTLGAEARQYGDAFPGYVMWAHAPRWKKGKDAIGFEVWRDRRMRNIYRRDEVIGQLNTETSRFHFLKMFPVSNSFRGDWLDDIQYGLDFEYRRESANQFTFLDDVEPFPVARLGLNLSDRQKTENHFKLRLVYDNVTRNNSDAHGLRAIAQSGRNITDDGHRSLSNFETFYYYLIGKDWNFASHLSLHHAASDSLSSQIFLGGLESIRGYPDGYLFGSKALYGNLEMRYIGAKYKSVWLQGVLFYDQGVAANDWRQARKQVIASTGAGIRISIPKVYRLMLRIDYGWGLRQNKTRGFTIGLNQFFQPYKPL